MDVILQHVYEHVYEFLQHMYESYTKLMLQLLHVREFWIVEPSPGRGRCPRWH